MPLLSVDSGVISVVPAYVPPPTGRPPSAPLPIQLTSTDGTTTIIDGVSDVFKIIASGTLSTGGVVPPGQSSNQVNIATGLSTLPTYLSFVELVAGVSKVGNTVTSSGTAISQATGDSLTNLYSGITQYACWTSDPVAAPAQGPLLFRFYLMLEISF
jgi:hypothetical protein